MEQDVFVSESIARCAVQAADPPRHRQLPHKTAMIASPTGSTVDSRSVNDIHRPVRGSQWEAGCPATPSQRHTLTRPACATDRGLTRNQQACAAGSWQRITRIPVRKDCYSSAPQDIFSPVDSSYQRSAAVALAAPFQSPLRLLSSAVYRIVHGEAGSDVDATKRAVVLDCTGTIVELAWVIRPPSPR